MNHKQKKIKRRIFYFNLMLKKVNINIKDVKINQLRYNFFYLKFYFFIFKKTYNYQINDSEIDN